MPKVEEAAKKWQKELAARAGNAVRDRRKVLNLTAAGLAKRTTELGYPVSRVAIGKIENGHREGKFDLAELVVLAAALGIPPVMLIYPDLPHGPVEVLPGLERDSIDALTWFSGENAQLAYRVTERFNMARQDVDDAAEPLLLCRALKDIEVELEHARRTMVRLEAEAAAAAEAGEAKDSEKFTAWAAFEAQIRMSKHQRVQTIRMMRALELPVHSDYDDEVRQ